MLGEKDPSGPEEVSNLQKMKKVLQMNYTLALFYQFLTKWVSKESLYANQETKGENS